MLLIDAFVGQERGVEEQGWGGGRWGGAVCVLYSCRVGTLLVASLASVVTLRVTRVLVKRRSSAPFFLHTWNSGYGEIDR